MWSCDRLPLSVLVPLALAACGFTPVYGPGGAAEGLTGQIVVEAPTDAPGYFLVRRLEERLGRPGAPVYVLDWATDIDEVGFGVTADRDTTRVTLTGDLDYRLSLTDGGEVVSSGEVSAFTGYSAPVIAADRRTVAGNPVTVEAAQEDAVERLMTILADQLVSRLLATAGEWRQ